MTRRLSALALAAALALSACRTGGTPAPGSAPAPALVAPAPPADATPGLVDPRPKARECAATSLRIPRRLAGSALRLQVHLTVSARGEARLVRVDGTDDQELVDALAVALAACPFEPATLHGEPVEAPYTLPLRFAPR